MMTMDATFWQAVQHLFESFIRLIALVSPGVLLAASEMMTAYASELCLADDMSEENMGILCALGAERGFEFYTMSRESN